jgi:hypothetical protein
LHTLNNLEDINNFNVLFFSFYFFKNKNKKNCRKPVLGMPNHDQKETVRMGGLWAVLKMTESEIIPFGRFNRIPEIVLLHGTLVIIVITSVPWRTTISGWISEKMLLPSITRFNKMIPLSEWLSPWLARTPLRRLPYI